MPLVLGLFLLAAAMSSTFLMADDVVAEEVLTVLWPEMFIASGTETPASVMLESADLRKSWTVRPSYSYHFELAPCFILPSPQATQARIHSRFQFVMSKTGPCLRKTLLSIFCNSESRGRVMDSSFFVTPGGISMTPSLRFTQLQRILVAAPNVFLAN